ncbi:MAG: PilZ domain-containing protein [Rhodanobacter sp.]
MSSANDRRAERKHTATNAIVTNVISGLPMGHLGNLSSTGLLLISPQAPRSQGLYQISVTLPDSLGVLTRSQPIELGIQEQWHEPAANAGQIWAGYRIVAITDGDAAHLESWLAQA